MRTFEDWVMYVFGGIVTIGSVVTARVVKLQDEHTRQLAEHAASIAALNANAKHTNESLGRIESKLDRVIERKHGA